MSLMTVQDFRDLLKKQPFQPFRLVMSSGQAYKVPRRDMAFVTKFNLLVGVGGADGDLPDGFKICPLDQIAAVEPLNDQPSYP
jgi:hypothetical protein